MSDPTAPKQRISHEQKEDPMSTTQQPTPPAYGPPPPYPPPARRLVRSRDDRWLGGVCGGVADYLGLDPTLVRVLVVLGTVLGVGTLVIAYLAAWILMPEE